MSNHQTSALHVASDARSSDNRLLYGVSAFTTAAPVDALATLTINTDALPTYCDEGLVTITLPLRTARELATHIEESAHDLLVLQRLSRMGRLVSQNDPAKEAPTLDDLARGMVGRPLGSATIAQVASAVVDVSERAEQDALRNFLLSVSRRLDGLRTTEALVLTEAVQALTNVLSSEPGTRHRWSESIGPIQRAMGAYFEQQSDAAGGNVDSSSED